jgi:hypothetical protein
MDEEQIAKIPTLDRFESDLDDFERELDQAKADIDYGEDCKDPAGFIVARKRITGVLNQIKSARQFIALRKSYLASLTPGVSTLVDDDQWVKRSGEHPIDRHSQDADRLA